MSAHSSEIPERAETSRRLVVSFHDLHPGSREVCDRFLKRIATLGIERITLLVIPCWHGGPPFTEDEDYTNWLRELSAAGHEICLHGYFHKVSTVTGNMKNKIVGRVYTASEGEFYQITAEEADALVAQGLTMLRTDAGLPVTGFTPPAWLLSEHGRGGLVRAGLKYSTTFAGVDLLQTNKQIVAPTIVWSCRNAWRRFVSRIWVRYWAWHNRHAPIVRIAVHPGDFVDKRVEASVYTRIEGALRDGRTPVAYADLVPPTRDPVPA
jgi:predicted deacetylase